MFQNTTLDTISLSALATAVNSEQKEIQLPAFQRDAVWNDERVELLWDSILRGFPIGALLFARSHPELSVRNQTLARGVFARVSQATQSTRFVIIDGQQRSNAISLGLTAWKERPTTARLWVDLGTPNNLKPYQEHQPFFVCSWHNPWGRGVTAARQREALGLLEMA
ncbi:MAG: DUF262 domain-containing protein, partial [Anaerolineales bacterium]|nr:DUF262 domain-containing protein [Anaerolineales bacterium]